MARGDSLVYECPHCHKKFKDAVKRSKHVRHCADNPQAQRPYEY
jgi:hypothetical protein